MTELTATAHAATSWTTKSKVGLGLAVLYAVANIPTVFIPVDSGDGPPFAIGLICTISPSSRLSPGSWLAPWQPCRGATDGRSLIVITLTALPRSSSTFRPRSRSSPPSASCSWS